LKQPSSRFSTRNQIEPRRNHKNRLSTPRDAPAQHINHVWSESVRPTPS
jgi:hypothetical protein